MTGLGWALMAATIPTMLLVWALEAGAVFLVGALRPAPDLPSSRGDG